MQKAELKGQESQSSVQKPEARHFLILPFALCILALALRLPGLTWGLPNAEHWYSYHPDERQIFLAVVNVASTDNWNPHFFNYPSLFIYLTYAAYLLQGMFGLHTAVPENVANNWAPMHEVMLCGRIVCALLGAFTIPAIYLAGKQLANEKFALFAAFLMAVAPGHVQHSHFATVDVPATFFVAWSLYFAVRAMGENTPKILLFSAFLAGLAAATKYNAGLVFLAPLTALFTTQFEKKIALFFGAIGIAFIGFVLGCPHSIFSTKEFLDVGGISGVHYELFVHSRQGHDDVFVNTGNGWIYHLTFNLPFAFTAPGALCAIVGLVAAARAKNKNWWPLLAFAGVYFLTLGLSQVRFMRYLFPLLPVLCLAVPICFEVLKESGRKWRANALALLMFIGATNVLYPFCVPDPRDQAAAFIKSQVTKPVTIALINRPWFYTPPLWPQDYPPPSQTTSGVSPDGKFRFEVVGTNLLKNKQADWAVFNEMEYREKQRLAGEEFRYFRDKASTIKDLWNYKNHAPLELPGRNFVPHDFVYTNPNVTIYRYIR